MMLKYPLFQNSFYALEEWKCQHSNIRNKFICVWRGHFSIIFEIKLRYSYLKVEGKCISKFYKGS